jgi:hypothetical protein
MKGRRRFCTTISDAMRLAPAALLAAFLLAAPAPPALAFSDAELVDGFERTIFGSEYPTWGWQAYMVKKFAGPARFNIEDRSAAGRRDEVRRFVRSLPRLIRGLDVSIVSDPAAANFRVFIVDRAAYRGVVTGEIYDRPSSTFAPGRCLVRVVSGRNGIDRSDAVIVADEGEFLFRRCMTEEILQGLGPINDDPTLDESVFNDSSQHAAFTSFDRHILNMLYDPRIRPGMTKIEVERLLPEVLADVRARLD